MASQGAGARNKGAGFERKVAKVLSNWIYGEPGRLHRTPMSGGLHWSGNAKSHGDIVPDDPKFPFVIECKAQEGWDLMQLYNQKGTLWNFIKQAESEGESAEKPWLLIFKKNHVKEKIIFDHLSIAALDYVDKIKFTLEKTKILRFNFADTTRELVMMELSDFITNTKILCMEGVPDEG